VLGVSTAAYLPYCFFNLLSPVLDVIYGYVGFKVPSVDAAGVAPAAEEITGGGETRQRLKSSI
jgi:hypothetical protein